LTGYDQQTTNLTGTAIGWRCLDTGAGGTAHEHAAPIELGNHTGMTTGISITPMEPDWFGVQVGEGDTTTSHRVHVPASLLENLGLADADRERVVRESFAFLLEREPPSSILGEFSLDVIPQYFPEYYDELRGRLTE
jgi:hypothetical protein